VGPNDLRGSSVADNVNRDVVALSSHPHNLAIDVCLDPFAVQDFANCQGNVFVLARNEMRRELNHRYFAAKTPIDLREFKAYVAAAEND
jgi:hypothetical protein